MEKRKLHKRFFAVLAVMLLILPLFLTGAAGVTAFAAETDYTDALEDLQKDENFNVEEYPDNAKDYSIQVIQIAESTAGELFIYTYQPWWKPEKDTRFRYSVICRGLRRLVCSRCGLLSAF